MPITINDNLQTNAPRHIDNKYMTLSGANSIPYANSAAAIAAVNGAYRYQYLTVLCLMNGDPVEYWWRGGTGDGNLETKSKESYTLNGTGAIALLPNYLYHNIVVLPTNSIANLQIGTTPGGTDIEPGAAVSGGANYTLAYPIYITSATSLYFSNVTTGTKIVLYKTF